MARMALQDILALKSCDSYHYGTMKATVAEVLPFVDITGDYHKKLKARMAETGMNAVPVLVYGLDSPKPYASSLGNGHHRVKIAHELGWPDMEVTSNGPASGWLPELISVII